MTVMAVTASMSKSRADGERKISDFPVTRFGIPERVALLRTWFGSIYGIETEPIIASGLE